MKGLYGKNKKEKKKEEAVKEKGKLLKDWQFFNSRQRCL